MNLSKIVRRTHMYLALFLSPWMLGYAVSTIAMSHRWTGGAPVYVKEGEQAYATEFAPATPPREVGRQILADLHLEGAYSVQGPAADGSLTINRQDLVSPRRIVYSPADRKLLIDRVDFSTGAFLSRFHRRRGYAQPYVPDRLMAVSVDAVVVALVFWALSGLWMWWEMRATRLWGIGCGLAGIGFFIFLTAVL
jgi:hypothetical protein